MNKAAAGKSAGSRAGIALRFITLCAAAFMVFFFFEWLFLEKNAFQGTVAMSRFHILADGGLFYMVIGILTGLCFFMIWLLASTFLPRLKNKEEQVRILILFVLEFVLWMFALSVISYSRFALLIRISLWLLFSAVIIFQIIIVALRNLLRGVAAVMSSPAVISLFLAAAVLASILTLPPGSLKNTDDAPYHPDEAALQQHERAGKPNVVLIVIETLRKRDLGCYGGSAVKTPHIDELSQGGIVFENFFAQSSWTLPSMGSILTSMYPTCHGASLKYKGKFSLSEKTVMVSEVLEQAGLYPVSFQANTVLKPGANFEKGFKEYHFLESNPLMLRFLFIAAVRETLLWKLLLEDLWESLRYRFPLTRVSSHYRDAEFVNRKIFEWLEKSRLEKDMFMYIHYFDPHSPYVLHPFDRFARVFKSSYRFPDTDGKNFYDSEVEYIDSRIGDLIQFMKEKDIFDSSLIILTSDHGEEFYEHGGSGHSHTLYQELIEVPLIIKLPFSSAGRVSTVSGSHIDIAPTILDCLGIEKPGVWQGESLLSSNLDDQDKIIFGELAREFDCTYAKAGRWKLIMADTSSDHSIPEVELFDLDQDPGEMNDVSASFPEVLHELGLQIERLRQYLGERALKSETKDGIDEKLKQELKALGYIK